jgi:FAD synthetase
MKKVMVFGTFDILHEGHQNFFRQAKKLGSYLIVVVARDKFVQKAKGVLPKNSERVRVRQVRKNQIADKVVLGSSTYNYFRTLRTHKPGIIALGYDQKPEINTLKRNLKKHRLSGIEVVRLESYKPSIYKSSKMRHS